MKPVNRPIQNLNCLQMVLLDTEEPIMGKQYPIRSHTAENPQMTEAQLLRKMVFVACDKQTYHQDYFPDNPEFNAPDDDVDAPIDIEDEQVMEKLYEDLKIDPEQLSKAQIEMAATIYGDRKKCRVYHEETPYNFEGSQDAQSADILVLLPGIRKKHQKAYKQYFVMSNMSGFQILQLYPRLPKVTYAEPGDESSGGEEQVANSTEKGETLIKLTENKIKA